MKPYSFLIFLFLFVSNLSAQLYPLITNIHSRNKVSMNGTWKAIVDPYETGYYDYRWFPSSTGFGLDQDISDKTVLQEYDFESSQSLFVPGDWNTQRSNLYYYEGTVWYRKRFDYTIKNSQRVFLHFSAVNYEAIVFLNGKELGKHTGGFTPFNFELTDLLKNGQNSIVVKVDNKRYANAVPTLNTDWWNYGGITREVSLIETPKSFVRDFSVQLSKSKPNTIEGWLEIDGNNVESAISISIPELKKSISVSTKCINGRCFFEIPNVKPTLWSPENPKLYNFQIQTANETLSDKVGFRTIETQGKRILLNNKEVFLKGICIHEESAYRNSRIHSEDECRTLLIWAKELGCNFIRLAHYPHNEYMIRLAEKMGLMVWSEIPVYWAIRWSDESTYMNAENQMIEMITRDKNRANIIIWSVANETPRTKERYKFLSNLISKVRDMDSIRLISAAMEKSNVKPGIMTVNDELTKLTDIISFNQYVGWYNNAMPAKCDSTNFIFTQNKPVFISEFGACATYGYHGAETTRFTEEMQDDLYQRTLKMLDRIDGLAGVSPWVLKDFRSPKRLLPVYQDEFNRKGIISDQGQKKKAYYTLQKWYSGK